MTLLGKYPALSRPHPLTNVHDILTRNRTLGRPRCLHRSGCRLPPLTATLFPPQVRHIQLRSVKKAIQIGPSAPQGAERLPGN
jgi:hypothetical protein